MKNYIIETLMVSLPVNQATPVVITLPNGAIPIGIEVRPVAMPEGLFLHHLIPCDEQGNPIDEFTPFYFYKVAWDKLGQIYGEQQNQEGLNIMDATLKGVQSEMESEIEAREEVG